jgi:uncharacterized protein with von Willebrand factor type A (vWA) domain
MKTRYRYTKWDGTQEPFAPGADELLEGLSESLFEHGDLMRALREMYRRGLQNKSGQQIPGLKDLMQRLQQQRQQRLDQFDLGSVMDDLKKRLEHVKQLERAGADRSVEQAQERMGSQQQGDPSQSDQLSKLMDQVRRRAEAAKQKLDALPESFGGAVRDLMDHDFIDPQARQEFQDLLDMLRKQMMGQVAKQAAEQLQQMSGGQKDALKEMLRDLNKMLRDRMEGRQPDFPGFMDKWGPMFGDNPPQSLDELMDMLQSQMAQMQSLMQGMSKEQRQQLMEAMMQSLDQETLQQLAELGALMQAMRPPSDMARDYPFMGEEPLTLDQAMKLMGEMQRMDGLEQALEQAARTGDLDSLDLQQLRDMLGPEAERALKELQDIAKKLEEQGYARQNGDRWELTPRTIRKLGEKALAEVFGRLGRNRVGGHRIAPTGAGGELTGATKPYEMGEPFDINLHKSLMNALQRRGPGSPVQFEVKDFEVDHFEATVSAATALLIDQSSSMWHYGRWPAAKKVAMALEALIHGQFPRDRLFVVGFSDHAEEIKSRELPRSQPNMWLQGTNMHHALMIARKLLSKESARNRQVIMVTDGEPTAHWEAGHGWFNYPPSRETIVKTLLEVKRCTSADIKINMFMLDRTPYLMQFVDYVTRINRGRAFFADPARLGDYVLVDYVNNRRKRVA